MRILHIPPYAPPIEGGSGRYCFNISNLLVKKGHDIRVFTSRDKYASAIIEGIPCYFFKNYKQMLGLNPLSIIYRELAHGVDWADVVHVHSYIYFLGNQVALYRKRRRFPFVLHLHGGTSPITSKVYGFQAVAAKIVYDVTVGKWSIQAADAVLASSKSDAKNAIERFDADPDRVIHIPNAVYVDNYHTNPQNPPVVTFLGRLTQLKGCYLMPEILRRIYEENRNVEFWLVGEGVFFDKYLERELKGLPVRFWGLVPHSVVPEILAKSSVLFLPSYTESSPLCILEAMASSVPVVSFDVGGVSESVIDNKTGFVVPVEDTEDMSIKISHLLNNDSQRKRMGRAGRKLVEEEFSWKVNVEKVLKIYEAMV